MKTINKIIPILLTTSLCFAQNFHFNDEEMKKCGQHYVDPKTNPNFKNQNIKYKWGIAFQNGKAIYFDQPKMTGSDFYLCPSDSKKLKGKIIKKSLLFLGDPNYLIVLNTERADPSIPLNEGQKIYCLKIENYKMFLKAQEGDWQPVQITYKGEIHGGENYLGYDTMGECLLFNIKTKWFEGNYVYVCTPFVDENTSSVTPVSGVTSINGFKF